MPWSKAIRRVNAGFHRLRALYRVGRPKSSLALLAIGLCLACAILFVAWRFIHHVESAVDSGRASLNRERLVPFETLSREVAPDTLGEWISIQGRILSLLVLENEVLVGATDGLHIYDRAGRHHTWRRPNQALVPGDISVMARHQDTAVLAVSGQGLLFQSQVPTLIRPLDESCRDITSLLSTPQGDLWIGTRAAGLLVWRAGRLERAFDGVLDRKNVTALAGDSLDLWVGTYDSGVMHFSHGHWRRIDRQEGLPDDQVTAITIGANGLVWIGTPVGGASWNADKVQGRWLEGEFIASLAGSGNQLLAGTIAGKVYALSSTQRATLLSTWDSNGAAGQERQVTLTAAADGILALDGPNVWELHPGRGHADWKPMLSLPPAEGVSLNDRNISSLSTDSQGRLWVGYFEGGLDIVNWAGGQAVHYRDDTLFCVNHIRFDPHTGWTYVATANGLAIFTAHSGYRVLRKEDGLPHDYVSQTAADSSQPNTFYAATAAGLAIFDSQSVRSVQTFHGLASNRVYSVACDAGSIHVGTLGGLSRVSPQLQVRNYSRDNSELRHNWINAVLGIGDALWIGTYGGGIQVLKHDATWHDPAAPLSRWHINPSALFHWGSLVFAGSLEAGFAIIRSDGLARTEVQAGLPSLNVTGFAADETYLYVGTDHGLMRYKQSDLASLLEDQAKR